MASLVFLRIHDEIYLLTRFVKVMYTLLNLFEVTVLSSIVAYEDRFGRVRFWPIGSNSFGLLLSRAFRCLAQNTGNLDLCR